MSQNLEEMLPVVDGQDQPLGEERRCAVHQRGLLHRAVHVLVFDDQGRLYLQLRSPAKDTHPGKWTSSASGHVDPGESYEQAAARELREELGLGGVLCFLGKLPAQAATENEFSAVYSVPARGVPRPDPGEISQGRYFTWAEALELAARPLEATPSLAVVLKLAQRQGLPPLACGRARPLSP